MFSPHSRSLVFLALASLTLPTLAQIDLGSAAVFGVLASTGVSNTGATVITGELGLSPNTETSITGFPPGISGTVHAGDDVALLARNDAQTAYNTAAGLPSTATISGDLTGQRLVAGVYTSASSVGLAGTLTLDGQNDPNAQFVFQIGSTLTTSSGSQVVLVNGAQACNVFWQIGSSATLGTTTSFVGSILALTSISLNDGVVVAGGLYALNGAITLIDDQVAVQNNCITTSASAVPVITSTSLPAIGPVPGLTTSLVSIPGITSTSLPAIGPVPGLTTSLVSIPGPDSVSSALPVVTASGPGITVISQNPTTIGSTTPSRGLTSIVPTRPPINLPSRPALPLMPPLFPDEGPWDQPGLPLLPIEGPWNQPRPPLPPVEKPWIQHRPSHVHTKKHKVRPRPSATPIEKPWIRPRPATSTRRHRHSSRPIELPSESAPAQLAYETSTIEYSDIARLPANSIYSNTRSNVTTTIDSSSTEPSFIYPYPSSLSMNTSTAIEWRTTYRDSIPATETASTPTIAQYPHDTSHATTTTTTTLPLKPSTLITTPSLPNTHNTSATTNTSSSPLPIPSISETAYTTSVYSEATYSSLLTTTVSSPIAESAAEIFRIDGQSYTTTTFYESACECMKTATVPVRVTSTVKTEVQIQTGSVGVVMVAGGNYTGTAEGAQATGTEVLDVQTVNGAVELRGVSVWSVMVVVSCLGSVSYLLF